MYGFSIFLNYLELALEKNYILRVGEAEFNNNNITGFMCLGKAGYSGQASSSCKELEIRPEVYSGPTL